MGQIRDSLARDRAVYLEHLGLTHRRSIGANFQLLFGSTFVVVALFRWSQVKVPILSHVAAVLYKIARIVSGIQIPRGTEIEGGLLLPHFGTIVVSRHARIGANCVILHNVTIGAKGRGADRGVPMIGSNVYIGAGAIVLGSIRVGDGTVIGAGSVVTKDVLDGRIVVGNPARER